jgi:hypothetical protein
MTARASMNDATPRIDKGIPMPAARFNEGHPFSILRKLDVGDSVFFRGVISGSNAYKALSNRMSYLKNTQGFMLTGRSVIESGSKGVRVWRTA